MQRSWTDFSRLSNKTLCKSYCQTHLSIPFASVLVHDQSLQSSYFVENLETQGFFRQPGSISLEIDKMIKVFFPLSRFVAIKAANKVSTWSEFAKDHILGGKELRATFMCKCPH